MPHFCRNDLTMTHEFKLIDTTYSPNEAQELIFNMIKEKKNFFKIMELANYVKFQEDPDHISLRIEQLDESKEELKKVFKDLGDDYELEVFCPVKIVAKKKDKAAEATDSAVLSN